MDTERLVVRKERRKPKPDLKRDGSRRRPIEKRFTEQNIVLNRLITLEETIEVRLNPRKGRYRENIKVPWNIVNRI